MTESRPYRSQRPQRSSIIITSHAATSLRVMIAPAIVTRINSLSAANSGEGADTLPKN